MKLTPTSATFVYNYGGFPGNAEKILDQHFDAMLFVTNWGTRKLMFRFPRSIIDTGLLAPYHVPDMISIVMKNDFVILDIQFDAEEAGGWTEGEGWLPSLARLRQDILKRDLRLLYLAWLKAAIELGPEADHNRYEPPVPVDLQALSPPPKDFVELFEVEEYLIKIAVKGSERGSLGRPSWRSDGSRGRCT